MHFGSRLVGFLDQEIPTPEILTADRSPSRNDAAAFEDCPGPRPVLYLTI